MGTVTRVGLGTRSVLSIFFATVTAISPNTLSGESIRPLLSEPTLECAVNLKGNVIQFTCALMNTDLNDLLVLTSPLTLEGPRSAQSFPHRHTGGDRYENILEFDLGTVTFNEGNVMFDPFIIPTLEEVAEMLKIQHGEKASFSVNWTPDLATSSGDDWWSARLKLVYTSERRFSWLQSRPYFDSSCPGQDLKEMGRKLEYWNGAEIFKTRLWSGVRYRENDECRIPMSLIFDHVYSNHMAFEIVAPIEEIP